MPQRGGDTVRACVVATENDDVLVFGRNVLAIRQLGVEQGLGVAMQKVDGLVDAVEFPPGLGQFAWIQRPDAEHDSIVLVDELLCREVGADLGVGDEGDTLGFHLVDAALHDALVELHVGDAIHQQSADTVRAFVHGDPVTGAIQLDRCAQARRARPDDGNRLAGTLFRRLRHDPALRPPLLDDRHLDVPDGHRGVVETHHA